MGLFSGIKKAAKKVSKVIKKGVTKVANKVAEVVETAGNKAQDTANKTATIVSANVPLVGGVLGKVLQWVGGVTSGLTDLAGGAIRGLGSIIVGVASGLVLMVGGILSLDFSVFLEGLSEIGNRLLGTLLVVGGKFVSLLQTILQMESRKRALTEKELHFLEMVFRKSVNLFNVRVITGKAGLFMNTDRPFTLGNTIYMKKTPRADWDHVLVHETTHAWQYQNIGPRYSSEALFAQKFLGNSRAYNWQFEFPKEWIDFNREAQANLIEHIFQYGAGLYEIPPIGNFVMPSNIEGYASGDYTAEARAAIKQLREP